MSTVTDTVTIRLDDEFTSEVDLDDIPLELVASFDDPLASRPPWSTIRLFPSLTGVDMEASRGDVEYTGQQGQLTRNEYIEFRNTRTANVAYPINNGAITTDVRFAYDIEGNQLNPADLSFTAQPYRKEILANRDFVGAIRVEYVSSYRIYRYQPEGGIIYSPAGQLLFANYGTVLAFRNQQFALLEIIPPSLSFDNSQFKRELYRVVSTVQVNQNGAWEKIDNFDSGAFWADPNAPRVGDSLFEYERVHEIGYISTFHLGNVTYETESLTPEQGPTGNPLTYQPATIKARFKSASDFANEFQNAYSEAEDLGGGFGTTIQGIQNRWATNGNPDIPIEGG